MRAISNFSLLLAAAALGFASDASAQVPVDDAGNPIGSGGTLETLDSAQYSGGEQGLSNRELELLVDRVALYPDDLLAIVLPAATYPLQVVEASRFLDALENDPSLKPDQDWDDSIIALINYPEIVALMNEDLEWTYALGEAFVMQQEDLLVAVDSFRDRAYAAGNLRSDDYQEVRESDEGIIEIDSVSDDVIYVPYYEPERVVVYQTQPVYHYYSRPYPVYYYPYTSSWAYDGYFYGLTSAFRIGWSSHSLHVLHHSHRLHPYYGSYYRDYWWYRRPSIHVHNSIYVGDYGRRHYRYGDYWRPRHERRIRLDGQRVTRSRHYGDRQRESIRVSRGTVRRDGDRQVRVNRQDNRRYQTPERSDTRNRRLDSPIARNRQSDTAESRRSTDERERRRSSSISSDRQQRARSSADDRPTSQRPSVSERSTQTLRPERQNTPRREAMPSRSIDRSNNIKRQSQTLREQRPTRIVQAPRRVESRPSPGLTKSRPIQSRPTQSRPSQTKQIRPTQSRPSQARTERPANRSVPQARSEPRRTESRPRPQVQRPQSRPNSQNRRERD